MAAKMLAVLESRRAIPWEFASGAGGDCRPRLQVSQSSLAAPLSARGTAGRNPVFDCGSRPADKSAKLDGCRHPAGVREPVDVPRRAVEELANGLHVEQLCRRVGRQRLN